MELELGGGSVLTVDSDPFLDIDVFGDSDDGFEAALDEGGAYEWLAEVEGFAVGAEGSAGCCTSTSTSTGSGSGRGGAVKGGEGWVCGRALWLGRAAHGPAGWKKWQVSALFSRRRVDCAATYPIELKKLMVLVSRCRE